MGKLGPYQENSIVVGDCLDVMRQMPDGCVDLIFADPWYFPENAETKNAFEGDVFWKSTKQWLKECARIVTKQGHFFISFSPQKMAKLEFILAELLLPLKSRIVWHYRNAGGRCASKDRFGKTYEMIYHIGFGNELNFPKQWGEERFDIWVIAMPQSNFTDKKIHPHQKPLALLERIISIGSYPDDLAFDPFMGSGTTAVAADRLGRKFFGCDINPEYVELSLQRLEVNRQKRAQVEMAL